MQTSLSRSPFHLYFGLLVALVVGVGFVPTLDQKLLHPPAARPGILYLHAVVFTTWVLLFIAQSSLVWIRRRQWHRRLGVLGLAVGATIPVLGLMTALTIARQDLMAGIANVEQSLIVPTFDMTAFAILFSLAIYWRHRPDFHGRFMVLATSGLTVAAFARFPGWLVPDNTFYVAVDVLIGVAVLREWTITHRVHTVYRYGVPALMVGQAVTMWILLSDSGVWRGIARWLLMRAGA